MATTTEALNQGSRSRSAESRAGPQLRNGNADRGERCWRRFPKRKWTIRRGASHTHAESSAGAASPSLRRKMMLANNPQQWWWRTWRKAKLYRAIYSNRQLEEELDDFWFNHFNVFIDKGADRFLIPTYEREAIRPHLWGKFRDLLEATATSPAMLFIWTTGKASRRHTASTSGGRADKRPSSADSTRTTRGS